MNTTMKNEMNEEMMEQVNGGSLWDDCKKYWNKGVDTVKKVLPDNPIDTIKKVFS